ncbi:tetratricopeptide repeat protein [Streptomyces sp. NPDC127119]|uniref:tetratricopeptide repeat protein n=1 Tax=Streptomyces sp. NPDC127119 TaxID=3345370 RepID=UPI003632DBEB
MAAEERRGRSRGDLIRQRMRSQFVGRRPQLMLFAENLAKDPAPESGEDPAEFLFHVQGVGGVGKSTLLRQWEDIARRAGAITAVVDESGAHDVQQAMVELARQMAQQEGPLRAFDRAVEQFRREQDALITEAPAVDSEASVSSRLITQAALGAASLLPGAAALTAMTNPDAAAQGLERIRAGARDLGGRRGRGLDAAQVSRAFVSELGRLCERRPWVVLFFDTWDETGRLLDRWLREMLQEAFGPLPVNVIVVLAGRDELTERDWAHMRPLVVDVPLEAFTHAEARVLLAANGVTRPDVVEAVLHLSRGLPLLVALLARARPESTQAVHANDNVVDTAVERFVQWITDPQQRETILACSLPIQLNEDIFAAAVPPEGRELWPWLCKQPFISGRGDFKHFHNLVRASMVRRQRTRSPQRWSTTHQQLADLYAMQRVHAEQDLPESKRWNDPQWRRHLRDETYHRLCAHPTAQLPAALEHAVHAADQETAVLRQWNDVLCQAAHDCADQTLIAWAERLEAAAAGDQPALAELTALLTCGDLSAGARAWAHTYRGQHLDLAGRTDEAITELDQAIYLDPHNPRAWSLRGAAHRRLGCIDQAISDLTTALGLDAADARTLGSRGMAHHDAGRYDDAVTDCTSALELDPGGTWAFFQRGVAHRRAGRYDDADSDFTVFLHLYPDADLAFAHRGLARKAAGRYNGAIADFTTALDLVPSSAWAVAVRGHARYLSGKHAEALVDLSAALKKSVAETAGAFLDTESVAETADAFLDTELDHSAVTDLLHLLAELPADDEQIAACVHECRQLVAPHTAH